jgi:hypothetical protein
MGLNWSMNSVSAVEERPFQGRVKEISLTLALASVVAPVVEPRTIHRGAVLESYVLRFSLTS